jgi:hypothetical protein
MRPSDEFYRAIRLSNIAELLTRARRGIDAVRGEMSRVRREACPPMREGFLRRSRDAGELEQALTLTESELEADHIRLCALLRERGTRPEPLPDTYVALETHGGDARLAALDELEARARALEARIEAHVGLVDGLHAPGQRI